MWIVTDNNDEDDDESTVVFWSRRVTRVLTTVADPAVWFVNFISVDPLMVFSSLRSVVQIFLYAGWIYMAPPQHYRPSRCCSLIRNNVERP